MVAIKSTRPLAFNRNLVGTIYMEIVNFIFEPQSNSYKVDILEYVREDKKINTFEYKKDSEGNPETDEDGIFILIPKEEEVFEIKSDLVSRTKNFDFNYISEILNTIPRTENLAEDLKTALEIGLLEITKSEIREGIGAFGSSYATDWEIVK